MKNIKGIIVSFLILLFSGGFIESFGQTKGNNDNVLIQGKWKLEDDQKSRWVFKTDGKMYSSYLGNSISSTPPPCQEGVTLAQRKNVNYLTLKFDKYNTTSCFYIFGLNDEVLTVMDAESGHTLFFIKAE